MRETMVNVKHLSVTIKKSLSFVGIPGLSIEFTLYVFTKFSDKLFVRRDFSNLKPFV